MQSIGSSLKELDSLEVTSEIKNSKNVRISVESFLPSLKHIRSATSDSRSILKTNGLIKSFKIQVAFDFAQNSKNNLLEVSKTQKENFYLKLYR